MNAHRRLGSVFFALLFTGSIVHSLSGAETWTWRSPSPQSGSLLGVTFGDGRFVAVAANGIILTSVDGHAWERIANVGSGQPISSVGYGNSRYVAAGVWAVYTSSNAVQWQHYSQLTWPYPNAVTFGGGLFLVASSRGVFVSADGATWSQPNPQFDASLATAAYSQNRFLVGGSAGIFSSADGVNWTNRYNLHRIWGIAAGNDRLVAVGTTIFGSNVLLHSADGGLAWTPTSGGTNNLVFSGVTHGSAGFVAVSAGGQILRSVDGTVWQHDVTVEGPSRMNAVAFGNNTYVAVGGSGSGSIWTSTDAQRWDRLDQFTSLRSVAYGNGVHVAAGDDGTAITSVDGARWTRPDPISAADIRGLGFGAGKFAAVGHAGTILTSPDGTHWTPQAPGTASDLSAVTHANDRFVAVGSHGAILTSSNGSQWTVVPAPVNTDLVDVVPGPSGFVAATKDGVILESPNGLSWSARRVLTDTASDLYEVRGLAAANNRQILVGQRIHFESDFIVTEGFALTLASGGGSDFRSFGPGSSLNRVTFAERTFVAVGERGTILTSAGFDWVWEDSGAGLSLNAVVFGRGRFVAVGDGSVRVQSRYYGPPILTGATFTAEGMELTVGTWIGRYLYWEYQNEIGGGWHSLGDILTVGEETRLIDRMANSSPQRIYRVGVYP